MGVYSPHYMGSTWPGKGVVITETQGSSPVETQAWALRLAVEVTLDAGLELHVLGVAMVLKREPPTLCFFVDVVLDTCLELRIWDAGFKLYAWALKWYWDTGFELCVLALHWCWDAGFEPCVLALHKWLWLALRLKHGLCYLMTCLQWFLDSLHRSLRIFSKPSTINGFGMPLPITIWIGLAMLFPFVL